MQIKHFNDAKKIVINLYPDSNEWREKVNSMKPRQVFAILRNAQKRDPDKAAYANGNYHQITMFEFLKPENKPTWHQMTIAEYLYSLKETN